MAIGSLSGNTMEDEDKVEDDNSGSGQYKGWRTCWRPVCLSKIHNLQTWRAKNS